jgi:DNA-binding NtrC family response regulator
MEKFKISLIDLDVASSSLKHELLTMFETNNASIQLHDSTAIRESCSAFQIVSKNQQPDVLLFILPKIITEIERALIRTFSREPGRIPTIAVSESAGTNDVIEFLQLGVMDFITAPIKAVDVMPRVWRLAEHVRKKSSLAERLKETLGLHQIIGTSPALTCELQKIPFIAGCDSSVLISGETGTGKEMFARAIHYLGPRAGKPFTPVNCGAIPTDLIENELFGHARGAFTSAITSANGLIHETDEGSLFLDEIDCMPLAAQVKLMRFLQEKEYRQLGSAKTQRADVRIIAATNTDLEQAVSQGAFRRDLYYRLNIIPLDLPPLRERCEDVPVLARHFIDQYASEFSKEVNEIAPEAMQKLIRYDWPGNVRELQNVIERTVIFSSNRVLQRNDILLPETEPAPATESFQQAKTRVVIEFEKNYIESLLLAHRGNITHAARTAGKNRRAFWELMRKHEIDTTQYRFAD